VAPDGPGHLIRAAADRLVAAAARQRAALASTLGLMPSDLLALYHLGRADGVTPGELAQALLLSSGGTTAVIDRLAQAGLIERSPGPNGRRRVLLSLTPAGRAATDPSLALLRADIDALTAELSPADRVCVERFLARLADLSERHADRLVAEADATAAASSGVPNPVLWG
jgi:DNA-binding MarR family transcriptional regulator